MPLLTDGGVHLMIRPSHASIGLHFTVFTCVLWSFKHARVRLPVIVKLGDISPLMCGARTCSGRSRALQQVHIHGLNRGSGSKELGRYQLLQLTATYWDTFSQ